MSDETSEKPKMAKRPHGLGRGLSALLGDVAREEPVAAVAPSPSGKAIQSIEVALIETGATEDKVQRYERANPDLGGGTP